MKNFISLCFLALLSISVIAQQNELNILHITSSHTSFPDTGRANGHLYNNISYDASAHYTDSSILIIVPQNIDVKKKVDLVFWFHGWNNNIDSALIRYQLASQFAASRLNAVLVLAETAKNSPDSYGGKLENPGVFKELVADVLKKLKAGKICKKCEPGNILLAGHSGAYRVMAYILQNGDLPVRETILFDALYADTDKFMNWIKADSNHRFLDIYTDHGGTDAETRNMMNLLAIENISYDSLEEASLTPRIIKGNRLIFIHSLHLHNDIINNPDNFLLFLENNPDFFTFCFIK